MNERWATVATYFPTADFVSLLAEVVLNLLVRVSSITS
jgi:hypothetical protein